MQAHVVSDEVLNANFRILKRRTVSDLRGIVNNHHRNSKGELIVSDEYRALARHILEKKSNGLPIENKAPKLDFGVSF